MHERLTVYVSWRWWFWPLIRMLVWIHVEPSEALLAGLVQHGMVVWVDSKVTLRA